MAKEQFIKQFKSSVFAPVQRDVCTEGILYSMGMSPEQKEKYWEEKSKKLAEEAYQKWIEENPEKGLY